MSVKQSSTHLPCETSAETNISFGRMIISSTWFTGRWLRDRNHEENMVVCLRQLLRCLIFCLLPSLFGHICGMWWLRFNSTVWVVVWYIKCRGQWVLNNFCSLSRCVGMGMFPGIQLAACAAGSCTQHLRWGGELVYNFIRVYILLCEIKICLFSSVFLCLFSILKEADSWSRVWMYAQIIQVVSSSRRISASILFLI